ncbi:uncharacterized protein LOC122858427 isoform X2 [Aphidius gifuensis]|uniref:uncharacterized protein LOC122858427 isoform X2 n=1 Tax=Aphidius gifuensis TaxID=684658 RepID=UPI001CDC2A05|nr:uncharacterized protein LOC122858427 isoform X2 [Aphidius gifuensis]
MTNVNQVLGDFYDALVRVRYPGVATIELSNLEATVLNKNQRNELLHWLLIQSLRSIDSTTIEPQSDNNSLVQWYSQIGICNDKEALLGECTIENQLPTIVKLTEFIMNILGVNGQAKVIPQEAENIINYYLKNEVNIIPSFVKLTTKLTPSEARKYVKSVNERVKEQKIPDSPANINREVLENSVDGKINENAHDTTATIISKFCETFEDINQWKKPNNKKSTDVKTGSFDDCIENINKNFSDLIKTLNNKHEVENQIIPTSLNTEDSQLDRAIKDVVVRMEELNKVRDHDHD